ncbi:MAG TPA: glycosyltransferase family 39 protein [Conexibacter sp.]|nr:glycosyltransferase family 39 protein [Conexibacter sp.]
MEASSVEPRPSRPAPADVAGPAGPRGLPTWIWTIVAVTLAGGALRFATLGHQSLWLDEAWTAYLVRLHPGEMLRAIPQTESTPPLYYLLVWAITRLAGHGDVSVRLLSAVAGTLTIPIAYAAGATLATRRVGLVAGAIAATSPILVWYSQEARSYALAIALASLSLLCFARARERPSGWRLAAWAAAAMAALGTHYFAGFVVAPEAVLLLVAALRARRALAPTLAALAAVGALGCALLAMAIKQEHHRSAAWIHGIALSHRLLETPREWIAGFPPGAAAWLPWAAGAIAAAAFALLLWRGEARERRSALLAGAIGVTALALPLLLAAAGLDFFLARNLLPAWLPLALVLAAGLGARRAARVGGALTVALCALSLATVVAVASTPSLQRPTWRTLAARLGPPRRGRAIVIRRYAFGMPLAIYRPSTWHMRAPSARLREIDVVTLNTRGAYACWWGATCGIAGARPLRGTLVHGFALAGRERAGDFTISRFVAARPLRVRRIQLLVRRGNTVLLDGVRSPVPPA